MAEVHRRVYWLIVTQNQKTGETKFFISKAPAIESLKRLLEVAFSRWQVEKWFERAKQECGLGAFEVWTYQSLVCHWLASRLAMYFLAIQTHFLREKNRRLPWNEWPMRSIRWPGNCDKNTRTHGNKYSTNVNIIRNVMKHRMPAEEKQPKQRVLNSYSAVILS